MYCSLIMFLLFSIGFSQESQMKYTTYYFSDSGNNSVVTSSFNLAKKILSRTFFLLDIELDNVTVPPVDGVTGATRPQRRSSETFEKTRGQVIIGVEQGLGSSTTAALNFYRSQEVDYLSNAVVATFSQDLFQKNTTITLRAQYNEDRIGEILESGSITNRRKKVYTGAANLSQLLSSTTVFDLSVDAVFMKGFLSDPYRSVKVFDLNNVFQAVPEKHPDDRWRHP